MKQLIIFAAFIALASAWGKWKTGLSVRFDVNLFGAGKTVFIPIPRTLTAAKNSRWVFTLRPPGPMPFLDMYCPSINDVVVCALYDDLGLVAGLQIALPEDKWTDTYYDFDVHGFTRWNAPPNSDGVERTYWTTQQYFVSEEGLKRSQSERLAANADGGVLQEKAVWVNAFHGKLMRISGIASEVTNTAKSLFTKQACIPFMGRHYYYNMTATTECSSEGLLPWFPMVDGGTDQLIATGFMTLGKLPAKDLVKDYFERPTRSQVKLIVPNGPECLYDISEKYGGLTMHIYYVNSPLLINCINY